MHGDRKDERPVSLSEALKKATVEDRKKFLARAFSIALGDPAFQYDEGVFRAQERITITSTVSNGGGGYTREYHDKVQLIRETIGANAKLVCEVSQRPGDLRKEILPHTENSRRTNRNNFLTITGVNLEDTNQLDQLAKNLEAFIEKRDMSKYARHQDELRKLIAAFKKNPAQLEEAKKAPPGGILSLSEILQKASIEERKEILASLFNPLLSAGRLSSGITHPPHDVHIVYDEKERAFRVKESIEVRRGTTVEGTAYNNLQRNLQRVNDDNTALEWTKDKEFRGQGEAQRSFYSFPLLTGIKLDDLTQLDRLAKNFEDYLKHAEINVGKTEEMDEWSVIRLRNAIAKIKSTADKIAFIKAVFGKTDTPPGGLALFDAKQQPVPPQEFVDILYAALKSQPIKVNDGVIECEIKDIAKGSEIYAKIVADIGSTFAGVDASALLKNLRFENSKIIIDTENIIKILPKQTSRPEGPG